MKSPRAAAALVALPLLLAVLGVILSMKKASFANLSVSTQTPIGAYKIDQVINYGNAQFQLIKSSTTLGGRTEPSPIDTPTVSIKSACPNNNGTESCSNGGGSPSSSNPEICVPSSAWALIVVNQVFASVAIIVQAAMVVALCFGKGNRMILQVLNGIAIIALLISVACVMNVPARIYTVCYSPIFQQQLQSADISLSYSFDVGGMLRDAISSFIL